MLEAERLQKILAQAGLASRREAEAMIRAGEVTINGKLAQLGDKAIAGKDHIKVRGKLLLFAAASAHKVVVALNKPRGMSSQLVELRRLLPKVREKIFPIGNLDTDAEGLLLLTNDGELAQRLTRAKFEVPQVYMVKIDGHLEDKKIARLTRGLMIEGRRTKPVRVLPMRQLEGKQWLNLTTTEPQNRLVRKLFENVGHPVDKVRREQFAGIGLKGLDRGAYRYLLPDELTRLRQWVGLDKQI